jgi:hypothetical protein
MIQLSLGAALALYGGIVMLGAVLLWLYTEISVQRTTYRLEKQHLWRCVFCAYTYLDDEAEGVSQCPRCGSFNSNDDAQARFVPIEREAVQAAESDLDATQPRRNPSRQKHKGGGRRGGRRRR